ncbi:hypothetical protein NDU88_003602 [Pleurodeles waltl]|uniref:Uncharacterized protein n=1 Tax=Pleurodeles waltl TaxID=8319 RepID=A0AAV7MSP5_PLEWA|nr:hypothetical protein NDU88_003602 [Pleurodeles waltl]
MLATSRESRPASAPGEESRRWEGQGWVVRRGWQAGGWWVFEAAAPLGRGTLNQCLSQEPEADGGRTRLRHRREGGCRVRFPRGRGSQMEAWH